MANKTLPGHFMPCLHAPHPSMQTNIQLTDKDSREQICFSCVCLQQHTKKIDSDALAAQISKGSAAVTKVGASTGLMNKHTGNPLASSSYAVISTASTSSFDTTHEVQTDGLALRNESIISSSRKYGRFSAPHGKLRSCMYACMA